ncbi:MAG: protein phosphatase CheZ [Rhodocyclaceae bacterium]
MSAGTVSDRTGGGRSAAAAGLAAERAAEQPAGGAPAAGDSEDLERLFDSVAMNYAGRAAGAAGQSGATGTVAREGAEQRLFARVGQLTRELHEALRELGYAPLIEQGARAIPDARQRLAYVSEMTEQAARRVLNAIDIARPLQEKLSREHRALGERWGRLHEGRLSVEEFRALAEDTRDFFTAAQASITGTQEQLTEIMMAQEFQDLTGQVIRKLVDTVQGLESDLLGLLVEFTPPGAPHESALANGPAVGGSGHADVMADQQQVDELLESLGF